MDRDEMKDSIRKVLIAFTAIIAAFVALSLFPGCSPKIIEKVRTEYVYRDRVQKDTTFLKDSVYLKEYIKGDTVRITEFRDRYHYDYKYIYQKDTVAVHDTTTVTKIQKVEKELTGWQKARLRGFWWLLAGLAGCLVWIFRKPIMALFGKWF